MDYLLYGMKKVGHLLKRDELEQIVTDNDKRQKTVKDKKQVILILSSVTT